MQQEAWGSSSLKRFIFLQDGTRTTLYAVTPRDEELRVCICMSPYLKARTVKSTEADKSRCVSLRLLFGNSYSQTISASSLLSILCKGPGDGDTLFQLRSLYDKRAPELFQLFVLVSS